MSAARSLPSLPRIRVDADGVPVSEALADTARGLATTELGAVPGVKDVRVRFTRARRSEPGGPFACAVVLGLSNGGLMVAREVGISPRAAVLGAVAAAARRVGRASPARLRG